VSGEPVDVTVNTTLEVRAGERIVRVDTSWDNRTRDQRVRAVFPLPVPATTSRAECAFAVVERGLTAEGGPTELGLPTFPSRRFVQAGGLTVAHEGIPEYELVDIDGGTARSIAITLARCTGMLSQGPMATRPMPAGPFTPMEGPQLQRPISVRYALAVGDDVDPYAMVEDAFVPLLVTRASGGATDPNGQALAVHGAEVSALRRTPSGALELRVFNPTPDTTTVTVEGRAGWLVDLRGRPIEAFAEHFDLGPSQIATAVLS
jgi:alpha-mannosidase